MNAFFYVYIFFTTNKKIYYNNIVEPLYLCYYLIKMGEIKMEKKNTGLIVTLIIFIMISLALGGFIVNDKVINKKEATEQKKENTVVEKTDKEDDSKEITSYVSDKEGIPYINLANFDSINKKITEFEPTVYEYHVFKNILFLPLFI